MGEGKEPLPVCQIINFTDTNLVWLLELVLGRKLKDVETTSHIWNIETKYYRAEVQLEEVTYITGAEFDSDRFTSTEGIIFYGEHKDLKNFQDAWNIIQKTASPAVCLLVVESVQGVQRTQVLEWCLTNQFELVECDEETEEDSAEDGIEEAIGRDRVPEALKAHTWSNLQLLGQETEGGGGESEDAQDVAGDSEEDDFETLFSQLGVIKARASNMSDSERKAYAEQVATAFYMAMGGSDEEE